MTDQTPRPGDDELQSHLRVIERASLLPLAVSMGYPADYFDDVRLERDDYAEFERKIACGVSYGEALRDIREAARWRQSKEAPMPDAHPTVRGYCPACRGESLFLGSGGYITCSRLDCPDPELGGRVLDMDIATSMRVQGALLRMDGSTVTRVIALAERWQGEPTRADALAELRTAIMGEEGADA